MPPEFSGGICKIFSCSGVRGLSTLKIFGFLWLVFSVDLDNSVFVKLLDFWFSLDNWIIDIVKVYSGGPFCNLRLPNQPIILLNGKI